VVVSTGLFESQVGFDFYQFWGVPVAHARVPGGPNPYVATEQYAAVLNALVDESSSTRLRLVNSFRRALQPLATPFFYASFAWLPAGYDRALAIFVVLQHAATAAAVCLLARTRGLAWLPALALAALVELTFNPFVQDVKVGNVNAFQLLAMALLLTACRKALDRPSRAWDAALGAAAAALVLFKPNTPWIALAVVAHIAAARGSKGLLAALAGAAAACVAAIAAGAAYLDGLHAWPDWFAYARRMEGAGTLTEGNLSLTTLVAHGAPALGTGGAVLMVTALAAIAALAAASEMGRRMDLAVHALKEVARDPGLMLSCAIVLTFATFPLVWPHYHLWALLPISWGFRREARWDAATLGVIACYAGFSRPVVQGLSAAGMVSVTLLVVVFSWVALVPAILAAFSRCRTHTPGTLARA